MTLPELNAELEAVNERIDAMIERLDAEGITEEVEEEITDEKVEELIERKSEIVDEIEKAEKREKTIDSLKANKGEVIEKFEEREIIMTNNEVRNSEAYINAYAEYLKSGDDKECRALLTENVEDGVVPVPESVDEMIKTAWDNEGITSRITKTYIKGNLKVGFEVSATAASIHTEGADAPDEEELVIGTIVLTPANIKKWISISTEVMDLTGQAFIDYIYDEITYQIAKVAANTIVGMIANSPSTSTTSAAGVATIEEDINGATIAKAVAQLADNASDPVIIMNRATYGEFKAAAANANYAVDFFDGLDVVYNNSLDSYADADGGEIYAIVGDLKGVQANFPNGEEVKFIFDEFSLAEADLVKIVGRQYVGMGVVAPYHFTTITKPTGSV